MKRNRDHEPNWAFLGFCVNCGRAVWDILKTFFG